MLSSAAEPFEDFGSSPPNETITRALQGFEECANVAVEDHMEYNRGPRSPGLRLGLGGRSPGPNVDESVLPPTPDESKARPGIKRTKSLMQKIKSMVRKGDESNPPAAASGQHRSVSMSDADMRRPSAVQTQSWRNAPVLEEETGYSDDALNGTDFNGHRAMLSLDSAMVGRDPHAGPLLSMERDPAASGQ